MPSATNARTAASPAVAGEGDDEVARRAAALLEASPGIYALRKRKRMSIDGQDEEKDGAESDAVVEKQVEQKGKKGADKIGGKAPAGGKSPVAKKARVGLFARGEPQPAEGTAPADVDDPADDSSLTSLSDLDEREPATKPSPAETRQSLPSVEEKIATVEVEEEDDSEQSEPDQPSEDDEFNPSNPAPAAVKSKSFGNRRTKMRVTTNGKTSGKKRPAVKKKAPTKPAAARLSLHAQAPPPRSSGKSSRPPAPVSPVKHLPRIPSDFRPPSMPSVMELYERREEVLQHARLEATHISLQIRSEDLIATALESLETGSQQTALSLAMNRYSSFCAHPAVDIPPFPITPTKISLFLSRVPTGVLSSLLLSVFPQPDVYPVPVAGVLDPNLTADESTRVTQELVRCWVDAFSFAQMATRDIWEPVLDHDRFEARAREDTPLSQTREALHPSLRPIKEDFVVREIIAAVESYEHMRLYQERIGAQRAAAAAPNSVGELAGAGIEPNAVIAGGKGKTKWTKGGKAVAAPSKSNTPATPLSQRDGAGTPADFPLNGTSAVPSHTSPAIDSLLAGRNDWDAVGLSYYPQLEAQLPSIAHEASNFHDQLPVPETATDSLFPATELYDLPSNADQVEEPARRRMSSSYASFGTAQPVAGSGTSVDLSRSCVAWNGVYTQQAPYNTGPSAFARSRHASHNPRLQTVEHGPSLRLPAMQPACTSSAAQLHRAGPGFSQVSTLHPSAEVNPSSASQATQAHALRALSQATIGRRDPAINLLGEAASLLETPHDQQAYAAPFTGQTQSGQETTSTDSMQRTVSQPPWQQPTLHGSTRRPSSGYPFHPTSASHRPKLTHQPASVPLVHRPTTYAHSHLPYIDEAVSAPSHLPPTPYSAVPSYEFDSHLHHAQDYTTTQGSRSSSDSLWRSSESQVSSYTSRAYPNLAPPSTGHFSTSDTAYQSMESINARYDLGATQASASHSTAPASIGIQLD
ncbi:hypothetical protein JCM10295v2_006090 [Rhodotorula toruloides]